MSNSYYIEKMLSLKEAEVTSLEMLEDKQILHLSIPKKEQCCPHCHTRTSRIKDYRSQTVFIAIVNDLPVYAQFRKRRYSCPACHRTFYPPLSFVQPYQRRSQQVQLLILKECRERQTFTSIAARYRVSVPTVIRYFDRVQYTKPTRLPRLLALDEFKGNAQGQKYQTSITNPFTHKMLDILPNRKTQDIIKYFRSFPRKQRNRVRWVIMDMSNLFRKVVQEVFPNAVIICDRFHIVRLVLWAMERVRKRIQKSFPKKSRYFKRNKRILRKAGHTLTSDELVCLEEILSHSEDLRKAYALKEAFYKVLDMKRTPYAEPTLQEWLELVRSADLEEFQSLQKSFTDWFEEIVNALKYPWSNGYTEGCNNKIKVLKRTSFGIRKYSRFKNRILYIA